MCSWSLVYVFPKEILREIVKYCEDFSFVLYKTDLFPVSDVQSQSRRYLMSWAAQHGYFSVFLWSHEQWCSFNANICMDLAAGNGHVDILQWIWEHDHPLYSQLCIEAAQGGHIHVLQWLRANGCPWDKKTYAWFSDINEKDDIGEWIAKQ